MKAKNMIRQKEEEERMQKRLESIWLCCRGRGNCFISRLMCYITPTGRHESQDSSKQRLIT
ncbi:hypothetical protein BRARA_H00578 [Brassica rapa]|uniref:Uncharacterized protein n=1 Tax=Brassica campestris TaxID=3711 RepID=A0A397Y8F4_BRACM|nr:hypothetical protein BRARA_H00578 [Brassica rapa]